MNSQIISSNPCSHRTSFTRRFLQALTRIQKERPTSSSQQESRRYSQRIKVAAQESMASAVGTRRAWSRAMLSKVRNRARKRALIRAKVISAKKNTNKGSTKRGRALSRADKLRRLVPGGKAMNVCNLLDETTHYIKCLTTQVQVMRSIADFYST